MTKIDRAALGIEVSWSFGDGDAEAVRIPRTRLREVLEANGFSGKLVEDKDHNRALRQAVTLVKGRSTTIVIQPLKQPNKDTPYAVGVYQVQAQPGEAGDKMVMGARVRVETGMTTATQTAMMLPPEGAQEMIGECIPVARELARIANNLVDTVVNGEISDAVLAAGSSCGWINRRRNAGGVYFISSGKHAEQFLGLLQDIKAETLDRPRNHQFIPQVMEVYPKPLTLDLWSGAARDQYDSEVANLVSELSKMAASDTMRDSTVEKRAAECDRLIAQAETHRVFLQDQVETITTELTRIRRAFQARLDGDLEAARDVFESLESSGQIEAQKPVQAAPLPATPPAAKPKRMRKAVEEMTDAELFDV